MKYVFPMPRTTEIKHIVQAWETAVTGPGQARMAKRAARFANGWNPFLTQPEDYPARLDFIKSQPAFQARPFELMHNASGEKIGEGHVARGGDSSSGGRDLQRLVDRLSFLKEQGVTVFSNTVPAVADIEAYLDYAQWFIEEVKPRVE